MAMLEACTLTASCSLQNAPVLLQAATIPPMEVPEESHREGLRARSEEDAASTAEQIKRGKSDPCH